jgi:hypothetical protein
MNGCARMTPTGEFEVPLEWIAQLLDITCDEALADLRAGRLTSVAERGEGEDAGHHRLSFFLGPRRARLTLDAAGNPVQRSCVDFGEIADARRPVPPARR